MSHYLYLLRESCLVAGLMKYAADAARRRASLPKFQVFDNSLKNVYLPTTMEEAKKNPAMWGRVYESAVGAYIMCQAFKHRIEVFYWREKNLEVDFVLRKNGVTVALEVKSNTESYTKGLAEFKERFKPHRALIIGEGGIPVEYFFSLQLPVLFT